MVSAHSFRVHYKLVEFYLVMTSRHVQVRARWPSHVVRRALDDVVSGIQPTWTDADAEDAVDSDHQTVQHAISVRNACELYTQRLADVIRSKVKHSVVLRRCNLYSVEPVTSECLGRHGSLYSAIRLIDNIG